MINFDHYTFADAKDIGARAVSLFKPPPQQSVSEWADAERYLSAESSASPGRFKTDRVPYMREPMEMVKRPEVDKITLMTSAQIAKSTVIENIIGYFIHRDPCPILHISPTLDSMKMFSKERLAPMIRDTPALRPLVKEARSRDSGNTINSKIFPGGHIAMVGSNAPAGLASRPIRVLVADEVDRFELSAGTEGDPLSLAIKRTTTFWNRVIVFVSTPGDKSRSRIEREFQNGDQRYYWIPCPHCGEMQRLHWANVRWTDKNPETAFYECEHNGCVIEDSERIEALNDGEWRAEADFNGNVSYHISQLYSPFAYLSDGVRDFLNAQGNSELLKTWVNTFLGETWEEKGKRLDWSNLMDHREDYEIRDPIPEDVTLVTCAVDVQDDRFEIEWKGWGDDAQSWSLGYRKIYGDLSTPIPWSELDSAISEVFVHPLFGEIVSRATLIDSGGHFTQAVYKFCAARHRVLAIRGVEGFGKPIFGSRVKNAIGNAEVYRVGVDTAKELVAARLRVNDPDAAGYCRYPASYDEDFFIGLTAEELRSTFVRGFPVLRWQKIRARNEPFDLAVYNTAALEMLQVDLNAQRRHLLRKLDQHDTETETETKPARRRGRMTPVKRTWAEGWKT